MKYTESMTDDMYFVHSDVSSSNIHEVNSFYGSRSISLSWVTVVGFSRSLSLLELLRVQHSLLHNTTPPPPPPSHSVTNPLSDGFIGDESNHGCWNGSYQFQSKSLVETPDDTIFLNQLSTRFHHSPGSRWG